MRGIFEISSTYDKNVYICDNFVYKIDFLGKNFDIPYIIAYNK